MGPLNEFYSIAPYNQKPVDIFQLENLGEERVTMSYGKLVRDGYGGRGYESRDIKQKTKAEDYNGVFALKLSRINPPYELDKFINYHLDYYIKNGGDRDKFIKHIQYVVFPYMEKWFHKEKAHLELTAEWIKESKKAKHTMIEYSELLPEEKAIINKYIQSIPPNLYDANLLAFRKTEIDELIVDNVEYHSGRIINFLLTNDFVKLWTYEPSYEFIVEGKKLIKYGSLEKYYAKQNQQISQPSASVVGHGNFVTFAGGNVTQSGITMNINQEDYKKLKELGVEESKIEELKKVAEENKNDKSSFVKNCMQWLGDVTKQIITQGLVHNLPQIQDIIANLIS
jgi:hypothetical protein